MRRYIACGAPLWEAPLLTLGNVPVPAQHVPDVQGVKQDRELTLDLYQYIGCGLIQLDCELVDYRRDAIQAGGFSKTTMELRRYQYKHLIESYHLEGKKFVEVEYGQGEFLKVLSELPVEVHGIEHGPHSAELARVRGLDVTEGSTGTEDTRLAGGLYNVFLSFSFPEYQPDLGTMLQAIYRSLEDDATELTTVPSFEYIMDYNSYYELIRDHLVYYIFETLIPLSERNGFLVEECEVINRDTLPVIVKKCPQMDTENLLECYVNLKWEMESYTKYLDAQDKKVAVWGASHQGFTLVSTTKLGERARYITDSVPLKQNKFTPASHLPAVGPGHFYERPVGAVIITASDYTGEVAASIRRKFGTSVGIRAICSNHLEMVQEE